jgi:Esterase/lipase
MNRNFVRASLVILATIFSLSSAHAVDRNIDYPLKDNLMATVTGAASHPYTEPTIMTFEPKPERRNVYLLEGKNKIHAGLYKNRRDDAPVVFIISGIGGNGFSGNSMMIGERLRNAGFTAVTLPDPLNYEYALGISETGVPGYVPRDVKEYYKFLKYVTARLPRYGVETKRFAVVGFSYGALVAAHLVNEDNTQKFFNFEKAVLINPSVDLVHGVGKLDGFYASGSHLTIKQKQFVMGSILNVGGWLMGQEMNNENILKATAMLPPQTVKYRAWIIGDSFRTDLMNLIYASQQIKDTGILKTPASRNRQNDRYDEAKTFTFQDYIVKAVIPSLPRDSGMTPGEMIRSGGLYPLMPMMAKDPRFFIQTNQDDFLVQPKDIEMFRKALGDRFYLYNYGGHVGNLWHPQHAADLKSIMTSQN